MCNVCCKEFKGWCKSFTRIEALLSILEVVLLLVLIGFLTFLILHFLACLKPEKAYDVITPPVEVPPSTIFPTEVPPSEAPPSDSTSSTRETLSPNVQCTWKPSQKTAATAHYYEYALPSYGSTSKIEKLGPKIDKNKYHPSDSVEFLAALEESDGEEAGEDMDSLLMALVRIRPMREPIFGCVLTVVSRYWALTAASCIEAVEETDSLDEFVMVEGYGERAGRGATHSVAEVRVHPQYAEANRSRDLAALRSEDALSVAPNGPLRLPTVLDHLLITIGERLIILGYGRFRTPETSTAGRGMRSVAVYTMPTGACGGADSDGEGAWAPRHLARGAPAMPSTGEIGPLCAGPLYARGATCNYCAGTPLARERLLVGVMARGTCGACEPAAYAPLAAARPWLDELMATIFV